MLKPESRPSQVHYEKIVSKLKLIAVIRKELKYNFPIKCIVLFKCCIL